MNDTHSQATAFLEKQLETEAPNLTADLRRSLASIGAHLAERKAEQAKAIQGQPEPGKESAMALQLPLWPEATRGTPNSFLRGALFAAIQGKEREYIKGQLLASRDGIKIRFTGMQLDQSDLDVWEQAAELARSHPLGNVCYFSICSGLRT